MKDQKDYICEEKQSVREGIESDSFNCKEYFHYDTLILIDSHVLENDRKRQGKQQPD